MKPVRAASGWPASSKNGASNAWSSGHETRHLGKRVNTDKTDAAELVSRLARYLDLPIDTREARRGERKITIVATLTDENGTAVQSEKLLEIDFEDGKPVRAGNQFAIGGVR